MWSAPTEATPQAVVAELFPEAELPAESANFAYPDLPAESTDFASSNLSAESTVVTNSELPTESTAINPNSYQAAPQRFFKVPGYFR